MNEARRPLSKTQRGIWLYQELNPNASTYNNSAALRLRGRLDREAIEATLRFLHGRHPLLRARFEEEDADGEPVAVVTDLPPTIAFLDLSATPAAEREEAAQKATAEDSLRPFDLAEGPTWRALLVRLDDREHILSLTVHHIVSDGWSLGVIMADLVSGYMQTLRWGAIDVAPLEASFDEFVAEEAALERAPDRAALEEFWKRRLNGAPFRVALRYDHPPSSSNGETISARTAPEEVSAVDVFCKRANVSVFSTLLATFAVLLHARSDQTDLVLTTPYAGRDAPELGGVVGCFVNTIPLRLDLSGNPSFHDLARRCQRSVLEAMDHNRLPFADLVRLVAKGQETKDRQVSNCVFVQNNAPLDVETIGELAVQRYPLPRKDVRYDLMMLCARTRRGFEVDFEYACDRFEAETAQRLLAAWQQTVSMAARNGDQALANLAKLCAS